VRQLDSAENALDSGGKGDQHGVPLRVGYRHHRIALRRRIGGRAVPLQEPQRRQLGPTAGALQAPMAMCQLISFQPPAGKPALAEDEMGGNQQNFAPSAEIVERKAE
jgi:hypothetical protein